MSTGPLTSPTPSAGERFIRNMDTGVTTDDRQERVVWVPEALIRAMHTVTEQHLPAGAAQMRYSLGRKWGESFFKRVEVRLLNSRPGIERIQEVPVRDFIKVCDVVWAEQGWGHFELVQIHGLFFINLYNSPYAQMVGALGKPVDHLFAGVFAGMFSELSGQRLECVEIMCRAHVAEYCRFVQGNQQVVEVIAAWQAQGATYKEILQRIKQQHETGLYQQN